MGEPCRGMPAPPVHPQKRQDRCDCVAAISPPPQALTRVLQAYTEPGHLSSQGQHSPLCLAGTAHHAPSQRPFPACWATYLQLGVPAGTEPGVLCRQSVFLATELCSPHPPETVLLTLTEGTLLWSLPRFKRAPGQAGSLPPAKAETASWKH